MPPSSLPDASGSSSSDSSSSASSGSDSSVPPSSSDPSRDRDAVSIVPPLFQSARGLLLYYVVVLPIVGLAAYYLIQGGEAVQTAIYLTVGLMAGLSLSYTAWLLGQLLTVASFPPWPQSWPPSWLSSWLPSWVQSLFSTDSDDADAASPLQPDEAP